MANQPGMGKYASYRHSAHMDAAQATAAFQSDLEYAQRMLSEAKAANDVRVINLAKRRIAEAKKHLREAAAG